MNWWTAEQDAVVRLHWGKGMSAAEIGKLLGKNKNQVIGRANRLGLTAPKSEPRGLKKFRKPKSAPKGTRRASDNGCGCQWLDGEPRERRFCGAPTRKGSSYCDHHHKRCFVKHEDYQSEAA